jgi:hypothetical protein
MLHRLSRHIGSSILCTMHIDNFLQTRTRVVLPTLISTWFDMDNGPEGKERSAKASFDSSPFASPQSLFLLLCLGGGVFF